MSQQGARNGTSRALGTGRHAVRWGANRSRLLSPATAPDNGPPSSGRVRSQSLAANGIRQRAITMIGIKEMEARLVRLEQLAQCLSREVALWRGQQSPLLDGERRGYL